VWIKFAPIDVGPGRAIDHGVGTEIGNRALDGTVIRNIEFTMGGGKYLVAGIDTMCHYRTPDHTA